MNKVIMIGCDLHDRSMLLRVAVDQGDAVTKRFANTSAGRGQLLAWLRERRDVEGAFRTVFAYEASGQGFGLYDELSVVGVECHVLSPSHLPQRPAARRRKTDERDADAILRELRGHVLAGNPLPDVWVPSRELRDDREVVRARLEAVEKQTKVQHQIKCLLKRSAAEIPSEVGSAWTNRLVRWLEQLRDRTRGDLSLGAVSVLGSLLRQREAILREVKHLERAVFALAEAPRYQESVRRLVELTGVAELTAMVFLTELGDLGRFANRRQIGAYLGLVPSTHESGEQNDRKGRITRQGPARIRKVLCQAVWTRVRHLPEEQARHGRIAHRSPKRRKAATVACMRRLAVLMWHRVQPHAEPSRAMQLASPAGDRPRRSG